MQRAVQERQQQSKTREDGELALRRQMRVVHLEQGEQAQRGAEDKIQATTPDPLYSLSGQIPISS